MRPKELLPMPVRRLYRASRDTARAALRDVRCWSFTEDDVRAIYAGGYHAERGYAQENSEQLRIKEAHAAFVANNVGPGKILEAGCSNGELVRQLRARGRDAWGFDITSDLPAIAYPDVLPFLRTGSLLAIPYQPEDGFETLVAIDVFEHIPRRLVSTLVEELLRLRVTTLVTLINHVSVADPGHVSLYPLAWWRYKLWPHFRLRPAAAAKPMGLPPVYGLDPADPVHVIRIWDRA